MIISSVLVLFGIGLTAAIILAVASKVLYVYETRALHRSKAFSQVPTAAVADFPAVPVRLRALSLARPEPRSVSSAAMRSRQMSPTSWGWNFLPWKTNRIRGLYRRCSRRRNLHILRRSGLSRPEHVVRWKQNVSGRLSRFRHLRHGMSIQRNRDGPQRLSCCRSESLYGLWRLCSGLPTWCYLDCWHDRSSHSSQ